MTEHHGIGRPDTDGVWAKVRAVLDNPDSGSETYTDEEWATAGERVESIRKEIRSNPRGAAAEARTRAEIGKRVRTLRAIRKARGLTQQQLSDQLRIGQGEVSRIERRGNLHLSTLVRFIEATGGSLKIIAVFEGEEIEVAVGDLLPARPPFLEDSHPEI